MREIKFRKWHKELHDMTFWDGCKRSNNLFWHTLTEYPEMYSLMQFTGLYDKNGKEIYEGDIVSYKRNVGNWTGKSLTTIHEIIFTEEINAFVMKDNSGYIKLRKHWGYEYEVIGNIYENA